MTASIYLKQVELGPMANYVYIVGDPDSREVAVVDPAWEVDRIVDMAQENDLNITKILITHSHFDHINGVEDLLNRTKAKVYINKAEAEFMKTVWPELVRVESGDVAKVGDVDITFIHTPGHTPGSQCFLVRNHLISGDTLFIGGCGRCDLPGSDPEAMYYSLTHTLAKLDDRTLVFPGHNYAPRPYSTIADEKRFNPYLQFQSLQDFLQRGMRITKLT
ncbi:MAG TPA: MBL fold metallo-hydrolase [Alphaproteobacteria bacterium]|nr:MBL fold metallo-hydrolase [Alphaproteobacteria bacterium]